MKKIHLRIGGRGDINTYTANFESTGDSWTSNFPDGGLRPDLLALRKAVYGKGEDDFVDVTIEGESAHTKFEMSEIDQDGNFEFKARSPVR